MSEILNLLMSENEDDVHLALIMIMNKQAEIKYDEMEIFINRPDMVTSDYLYNNVCNWIGATSGRVYAPLRKLATRKIKTT